MAFKNNISNKDLIDFKQIFKNRVKSICKGRKPALAMSGGIDSMSVFFTLIELNIDFECYTFFSKDYNSEDLISSIKYCEFFDIKLNIIELPSDVDSIYKDICDLIPFLGKKIKKTKVETLRPLKYLFEKSTHDLILNGLSGDDYQPNGRRVNIELKKNEGLNCDQHVIDLGFRVSKGQVKDSMRILSVEMAKNYKIDFVDVYESKEIENFFLKFELKTLLKPHKHLVTKTFENYFNKIGGFRNHSSYQVNSKIRDFHENLIKSKYNKRNSKNVIAIYNDIANEYKSTQLNLFENGEN